ncbi:hypothetical protein PVAP13_J683263 [Panicum virgatum]|nr:hypothetical protein PVAP13_J683263 [Panicum virgatum]
MASFSFWVWQGLALTVLEAGSPKRRCQRRRSRCGPAGCGGARRSWAMTGCYRSNSRVFVPAAASSAWCYTALLRSECSCWRS